MRRVLGWVAVVLAPVFCVHAFGQMQSARSEDDILYEVTRDPSAITVESARFWFRKIGDRLWVEKLYVVQNRTDPPQIFYDERGTFRYQVPSSSSDKVSVMASGIRGTPMPQSVSPLPDGSGYIAEIAFKPGATDVVISYDVDYASRRYLLREESYYPLAKLLILVEPSDIVLDAAGWEELSPQPRGRFSALRRFQLPVGSPIELQLSSRDGHVAATTDNRMAVPVPVVAHGQPTRLPDRTRTEKWVLVLTMAAALAFGLIASLALPRIPR